MKWLCQHTPLAQAVFGIMLYTFMGQPSFGAETFDAGITGPTRVIADRAYAAYQNGDYAHAKSLAQAALRMNPESESLRRLLTTIESGGTRGGRWTQNPLVVPAKGNFKGSEPPQELLLPATAFPPATSSPPVVATTSSMPTERRTRDAKRATHRSMPLPPPVSSGRPTLPGKNEPVAERTVETPLVLSMAQGVNAASLRKDARIDATPPPSTRSIENQPTGTSTLTMLQALQKARAHEARHRAAQASFRADSEVLPQAQAGLKPEVSAALSRTSNQLGARFSNGQSSALDYYSGSSSVSARQPLYRPEAWARVNQARSEVERLEAVLLTDRNRVMLDTATSYLELLRAHAEWEAMSVAWQSAQNQLSGADRGVSLGLVSTTDRDDRLGKAELAKLRVAQAATKRTEARRKLEMLTGQPVKLIRTLDDFSPPVRLLELPDIASLTARAQVEAPSVRAAVAALTAARHSVERAKAAHQPTVDLVASRSKSSSDNFNSINSTYVNTAVGVQLNIPLYAGGRHDSGIRQAVAQQEQAEAQLEQAKSETTLALEREFQLLQQLHQRVQTHEAMTHAASQVLANATAGYTRGTKSQLDVSEALANLGAARYEKRNALLELLMARVRLEAVLATLDDDTIERIDRLLTQPVELVPG